MAQADTIWGEDFNLFFTISGSTKKCVALSSGAKISISWDEKSVSTKDSGKGSESKLGRYKYSISVDGLVSQDAGIYNYDWFLDKALSKTLMTWTLGKTTGVVPQVLGTGKQSSGTCWITKVDLDTKNEDWVSFSLEFSGTGEITRA